MFFCSFDRENSSKLHLITRIGSLLLCLFFSCCVGADAHYGQASKALKPRLKPPATQSTPPAQLEQSLWQQLVSVTQQANPLALQLDAQDRRYQLDESIQLDITLPPKAKDYHLNIVTVDKADLGTVLFPNQFVPEENRQTDQKFVFPDKAGAFDFYAMAPTGKTLIAVFATKAPLNLYLNAEAKAVANENYTHDEVFALLTPDRLQQITQLLSEADKNQFYAASIEFTTIESRKRTTTK